MTHVGFVSWENKAIQIKELIGDASGAATLIATWTGVINLCITLFGNVGGQSMKTLSLVYRWIWGGLI